MSAFASVFSDAISGVKPATQQSQVSSFGQILNSTVAGTVAVVQAIKAPSTLYKPPVAGTVAGGSVGAAQAFGPGSNIALWLLGGALVAMLAAFAFFKR